MLVLGSYGLVLGLLGWMVLRVAMGTAGPNPVNDTLQDLGVYGLLLLLASLAVRPLVQTKGWRRLLPLRKAFGLQGFALVSLHVLIYLGLDQGLCCSKILPSASIFDGGFSPFSCSCPLPSPHTAMPRGSSARLGKSSTHSPTPPLFYLHSMHGWLQKPGSPCS
jgi:hypothetical protein